MLVSSTTLSLSLLSLNSFGLVSRAVELPFLRDVYIVCRDGHTLNAAKKSGMIEVERFRTYFLSLINRDERYPADVHERPIRCFVGSETVNTRARRPLPLILGSDKGARDQTGSTGRRAEDAREEKALNVSPGRRLDRGNAPVDNREGKRGGDGVRFENLALEESALPPVGRDLSITIGSSRALPCDKER